MTYLDTFYLDVRSVNRANKRSEQALRFIFQPIDKTAPTKPEVNMAYSSNHTRVYLIFSKRASDPETGVDHYEVAVGSQPNGTFNYVSWSDSIQFKPTDIGSDNAYLLPVLPNHTVSYIAVRAVNKQGKKGEVCYTGPYYNDSTPPVTPSVQVNSYRIYGKIYMALLFSNLQDPETGIIGVDYKIEKVTWTQTSGGGSGSGGGTTGGGATFGGGGATFNGFGNGGTFTYGGGGITFVPHYETLVDWTAGSIGGSYLQLNGASQGDMLRISVRSKNGALLYSQVYSTNYTIPQ